MNANLKTKGPVAKVLDEELSETALDRRLERRHEEIEAMLHEARESRERGAFAALEPPHAFLRRARNRFKANA
ncbi:MAG TPA: hypothetical protein VGG48_13815 [Rhizomicrobium sp.]|jgi:hypothetical protein